MKKEKILLIVFLLAIIVGFTYLLNRNTNQANLTASVVNSQTQDIAIIAEFNNQIGDIVSVTRNLKAGNSTIERLLEERKTVLLRQAQRDPASISDLALSSDVLNRLRDTNYSSVERLMPNISGSLTTIFYDDFENPENSRVENYLTTDDRNTYRLYMSDYKALEPNSRIEIEDGVQIGDSLIGIPKILPTDPIESISNETYTYAPTEVSPYKIGVFLVNPTGNTVPLSAEQMENLIFNSQFQKYIKEASYGKRYLSGDIYGWIEDENLHCGQTVGGGLHPGLSSQFAPAVEEYVLNNNIPLDVYKHFLFIANCGWDGGSSTLGPIAFSFNNQEYNASKAKINGINWTLPYLEFSGLPVPDGIEPWSTFDYLLAHEFGHSLGLGHSNGLDCDEKAFDYWQCDFVGYGNLFDVMGSSIYSIHYNIYQKKKLNWIDGNQILKVDKSGVYTITPLETNKGIKMVEIINPHFGSSTPVFFVENRKGVGFDNNLNSSDLANNQNGILINYIGNNLIDAQPTKEQSWIEDLFLAALTDPKSQYTQNSVFFDDYSGIKISNVTKDADNISFKVDLSIPKCGNHRPRISTQPGYPVFEYSNESFYQKRLFSLYHYPIGLDLCPDLNTLGSNLRIEFTLVSGQSYIFSPTTAEYYIEYPVEGQFPTKSLTIGTDWPYTNNDFILDSNIQPGTYKYEFKITNINFPEVPPFVDEITIKVNP